MPEEDDMDQGDVQRLVEEHEAGDEEAMAASEMRFCNAMCEEGPCDLPKHHDGGCVCLVSWDLGGAS